MLPGEAESFDVLGDSKLPAPPGEDILSVPCVPLGTSVPLVPLGAVPGCVSPEGVFP